MGAGGDRERRDQETEAGPQGTVAVHCGSVLQLLGITAKSTMTHHWRVLRESGVIWQHPSGRENLLSLRREDLDARYPGLLDAVLAGAAGDEALENAPGTAIR
ncbi:ArsR/SmtB family transcription factor [Streptomyces cinerochromogenes]|uniref:ArsR/SmtB family transcription factor n=1 Tax=Streptomyces cinerochromogenes TaxID=66422 RepID=UPI00369A92CA